MSLETFRTFSTFLSSVVIAGASIVVTVKYNDQQFAITQRQAESQLEIARVKEISNLIPKLGSDNANERKFSAIALSLYGESAVSALIASFDDENSAVREASSRALALIGTPAVPKLIAAYSEKRNPENMRALAMYTLGMLPGEEAMRLAIQAVGNPEENPTVRKDAATALGTMRSVEAVPALIATLTNTGNITLIENSTWALGEIGDVSARSSLIALFAHSSESVRSQAVWAVAKLRGDGVEAALMEMSRKDPSEKVRKAAADAIPWMNSR
jgi:HEAT repeat protein